MKRTFFVGLLIILSSELLTGCFCKVPNAGAAYMTNSAPNNQRQNDEV